MALMLFVSACASATDSLCVASRPIVLTDATIEAMTEAELRQVYVHNETWERLCG